MVGLVDGIRGRTKIGFFPFLRDFECAVNDDGRRSPEKRSLIVCVPASTQNRNGNVYAHLFCRNKTLTRMTAEPERTTNRCKKVDLSHWQNMGVTGQYSRRTGDRPA